METTKSDPLYECPKMATVAINGHTIMDQSNVDVTNPFGGDEENW